MGCAHKMSCCMFSRLVRGTFDSVGKRSIRNIDFVEISVIHDALFVSDWLYNKGLASYKNPTCEHGNKPFCGRCVTFFSFLFSGDAHAGRDKLIIY